MYAGTAKTIRKSLQGGGMGVGSIPGGIIFVRISSVGISGNSFCTYLAVSLAGLQLFKIVLLAVQNIVAPQPN